MTAPRVANTRGGRGRRIAWWAGIAVTALIFVHGAANLAGGGSFDSQAGRLQYGLGQIVAASLIAGGLWLSSRTRRRSVGLVAAGVVVISILMPWFIIFTIPVGFGLIAVAYARSGVAVAVDR